MINSDLIIVNENFNQDSFNKNEFINDLYNYIENHIFQKIMFNDKKNIIIDPNVIFMNITEADLINIQNGKIKFNKEKIINKENFINNFNIKTQIKINNIKQEILTYYDLFFTISNINMSIDYYLNGSSTCYEYFELFFSSNLEILIDEDDDYLDCNEIDFIREQNLKYVELLKKINYDQINFINNNILKNLLKIIIQNFDSYDYNDQIKYIMNYSENIEEYNEKLKIDLEKCIDFINKNLINDYKILQNYFIESITKIFYYCSYDYIYDILNKTTYEWPNYTIIKNYQEHINNLF